MLDVHRIDLASAMLHAANYRSVVSLRDGGHVEIRVLNQDDQPAFLEALDRMSASSLYRRFISAKRTFTPQEVGSFLNIDFVTHVALVAIFEEIGQLRIVGTGRYIVASPGRAEVAFAVIDQYQGQGIGKALLHHLAAIACESGLEELFAEVLPSNLAMLKVFEKSGYSVKMQRGPSVVDVTIDLGSRC